MTKQQIVLLSLAAAGVTAAVAGALLFFFAGSQNGTAAPAAPAAVTARSDSEQEAPSVAATAPAAATTAATAVSASVQVQKETTAAAADGESEFFSGVYAPDSRAEDITTGDVVHLRTLFGSVFRNAVLTFGSDGAFSDTLVTPEGCTGTYRTEGEKIRVESSSGRAPEITVTAWKDDGVTPAMFCAVYKIMGDKGYRVFFSEKV